MKKSILIIFACLLAFASVAQDEIDSLSTELKKKIFEHTKNFTFGFYIDTYYSMTFGGKQDTGNLIPFSANCPVHDQIRLNFAALEIGYNNNIVRGKLAIQYGDSPNLLANPSAQFIKNIRQANIGFRLVKDFWIDFGYMFNPVGVESSWPVLNAISTASVGGYFEPGNLLGVKLTYKFSSKFTGGYMFGNPYSLAYDKNTHMAGILFFYYYPNEKLMLNYNAFFGNQALIDANIDNDILYNNLICTWKFHDRLQFLAEFDLGAQTNSTKPPDTNKVALMYSGFLQAKFSFFKKCSLSGRFETFNDPNGFLSGMYSYEDNKTGLMTNGFALSLEYKPAPMAYVRMEYRMLFANQGNLVFYSNTSDQMAALTFTTGIRF